MMKLSEIKNKTILLDSCVLIAYSTTGFQKRSGNPLRTLYDNKNKLVITPIQAFELLKIELDEKMTQSYLRFLNFFPCLPLKEQYFRNAAMLNREYFRVKNKKTIPEMDLIMGGIMVGKAFTADPFYLFTSDREDFCEPLWNSVASFSVPYEKDPNRIEHNFYILEFNRDAIPNDKRPR